MTVHNSSTANKHLPIDGHDEDHNIMAIKGHYKRIAISLSVPFMTFVFWLQIVHGAFIEPHHVMRKRSIDQPLRIILHYDESVHK